MSDRREMEAVIEAILFVSNDPVPREKLLEVFAKSEHEEVSLALETVLSRFDEGSGHGIVVDEVAGGLRLMSRPDLHGYLRRFFEVSGTNKLTMAALETLAIVAYRQPITGPEVQELRGVNSSGVLKKLLERRLVRISGRKEVVGKPFLYTTTRDFLMHFGLRSLKELPPLEQFEELLGAELEGEASKEADLEEEASQEAARLAEAEEDEAIAAESEAIAAERRAAEEEQDLDEAAELVDIDETEDGAEDEDEDRDENETEEGPEPSPVSPAEPDGASEGDDDGQA